MRSLPQLLDTAHSQSGEEDRIGIVEEKCPYCDHKVSYEPLGPGNPVCDNPSCEMYKLPIPHQD